MGLSPAQISRLVKFDPGILVSPSRIPRLEFYISLLGSYDKVEVALKTRLYILGRNIEKVVEPNTAFLQQCGLTACHIAKLIVRTELLTMEPERVKEMVARAEMLGVRRCSGLFMKALVIVCNFAPVNVSAKRDLLEKALGCSEAEYVRGKAPGILSTSEGKLVQTIEFLKMEVMLDASYIARRPVMLSYSLERRLMPRHYVIQVLKAKELVTKDIDFYSVFALTEKRFVEKFLDRYNECVPGLADAYAAACAGQIPKVQL
ncbi:uncharacterized protein LOC100846622 [Brachypodium distachyon]|uniref:Uncharacterized protein n=1 Tax=Brachypodium distachyon TaxID=15368 RepID=I1IF77_BRADI|nr:uncharacterized protein LOC100846622 [Brachypodium distachyon]PNT69630.1 hypothetical protein BRADI_3g59141v3 [Brachypodium distachyon]|eukprot:XP_014756079.1 uncharacterized protein LOC100846622 [Brachypodium distachyon]